MADANQTHYTNTEFDLALRPRPARLERPSIVRQVRELSAQALLGADEGDAALLRTPIPEEFLTYLEGCGVPLPRLLDHPRLDPESRLRPFGWSAEAIELNRRHAQPVEHPALEVIERVNRRSFSAELEAEISPDGPQARGVDSLDALESWLVRAQPVGEWLVKGEHGNSGLANRRLRSPRLSTADRRFVEDLLAEDDRLIVEPWLARERDWCVVFDAPFAAATFGIHETICTRDGALVGALFEPGGPTDSPWNERLGLVAQRVAGRLTDAGYFGPVCMDAFSWRDGARIALRPLVDLNCRRAMSEGARRLWRRMAPERTVYYRFFNRRKLELPQSVRQAVTALGDLHYDRRGKRGALFASPLGFAKLAVMLVAQERSAALALERAFRARFEP